MGASNLRFNSLTFGSNAGSTQIDRGASPGSGTATILGLNAGGLTVDAGAGPVTFGRLADSGNNQRVIVGVYEDLTVANNSSTDLTFNREFDGRGAARRTVTVAGSGDGDTIFKQILSYDANRDLAMTINKTSGTGVVRFEGSNNYTGATIVTAGKLVVNGSSTNSAFTVQSGAVLGGSGAVGATTILSGATIAPGNSPGTLTNIGDLTLSGGGSYDWEIFNATGTPGTDWDFVSVTERLLFVDISSTNKFNINIYSLSALPDALGPLAGWNPANNFSWTILSASNGLVGFNAANFNLNLGNFSNNNSLGDGLFSLIQQGNDLNLLFTAGEPVPEPGTWAAACLLAAAAGYARWRRRRLLMAEGRSAFPAGRDEGSP